MAVTISKPWPSSPSTPAPMASLAPRPQSSFRNYAVSDFATFGWLVKPDPDTRGHAPPVPEDMALYLNGSS